MTLGIRFKRQLRDDNGGTMNSMSKFEFEILKNDLVFCNKQPFCFTTQLEGNTLPNKVFLMLSFGRSRMKMMKKK